MDYFVLDWETFYDSKNGYTLKKMTTEEYINDPRFHAFGFSLSRNGGKSIWIPHDKIPSTLQKLGLHNHAVIMHNAPFDAAILNWKYGIRPKLAIDTLAMARGVFGNEESLSLDALSDRLNLGRKGKAILNMDGVRYPSADLEAQLAEYAKNDADLTWKLWMTLKEDFPKVELVVIDITTRMFSEPSFVLDPVPINRELEIGEIHKQKLLQKAGCTLEDLRSDERFAALLEMLGVSPPKKISAKKSAKAGHTVYTWAFAKSDVDFKALADHEDEMVRWAVEARLGLKSTIKQSRADRFSGIQKRMGVMPVALTYYGAGTGRYAAASSAKVNMQNLPAVRGSKDPDVGLLRKSLTAPPGKVVVVSDASQIEARIVAWLAGQTNVVEAFAQGRDVYSEMASLIFSRFVDRKNNPDDYIPGFIGKCVVLGCGYGLGHIKFSGMIYAGMLGGPSVLFDQAMADKLGVNVNEYSRYLLKFPDNVDKLREMKPASLTEEQWVLHAACAKKIIDKFRENNRAIPEYWKTADSMLDAMYKGTGEQFGLFKTEKNRLLLPNGMWLHFKDLQKDEDGYSCMRRKDGKVRRVKVYGGSVVENLCQALAGAYVKEAMARMYLRGYRPILQVHDEVVVIADESDAEHALEVVTKCMETQPAWADGLPLASEGDFAKSYGEAK